MVHSLRDNSNRHQECRKNCQRTIIKLKKSYSLMWLFSSHKLGNYLHYWVSSQDLGKHRGSTETEFMHQSYPVYFLTCFEISWVHNIWHTLKPFFLIFISSVWYTDQLNIFYKDISSKTLICKTLHAFIQMCVCLTEPMIDTLGNDYSNY